MKQMQPYMLIIYGPTAVGKTDFALSVAKHVPVEIINMDVGQFYTPLSIGTAKPDWQSSPIAYHLFDILDKPEHFSVTAYRAKILKLLPEIWRRNRLPILVGGSGFYLKSLFFPPLAESNQGVSLPDLSAERLWQELYKIDPDRARAINKNDLYRIKRALTIWYTTGIKPSSYTPVYDPPSLYHVIYLTRERQELHARINKRVKIMIEEGWEQEVTQLRGTPWEAFVREKNIIGYPELLAYCLTKKTPEQLGRTIGHIQKRTRHYAKRQRTFWQMLKRLLQDAITQTRDQQSHITEINLTEQDQHAVLMRLIQDLQRLGESNEKK